MARIQIETPGAIPMAKAIELAFQSFGCEPLGGPSNDGWSKIADLQRCAYRYYLRHELQATVGDGAAPGALEVGSLYHASLALHYCRQLPEGFPGWRPNPPPPMDFVERVGELNADAAYVAEARRLLYGYLEHHSPDDLEPVAVEYGAGIEGIHTCRFDMLAWRDGALWNVEHKTSAFESAQGNEAWWLDGEIIGEVYAWKLANLERLFGAPLAGVIINLAFKSKPPKYKRLDVVVPDKVLETYARDRQFWSQQREHFRRAGHWPKSLWGCNARYDTCTYFEHCRDEDQSLLKVGLPPGFSSSSPSSSSDE